ncbi:hypothetical protein CC78DRAFT_536602 [Lojkania enalia]|uniref:Uncharacterized protein n=1 Tax=Lojkania enalia TaxID=147567 RepID=A0A9P4MZ96_9PLEO|nr:hypothetical protein CC78DRAFT_536602 [Didymosphaeria enalia]
MAHSDGTIAHQPNKALSTYTSSQVRRSSNQKEDELLNEKDVIQGRIFWLPPQEELPVKAVRRAHGKGAVDDGIYNHPVVVISRPAEDSSIIHFHLITSFQGKKLHEIYGKSNDFHASRRSWYLPIAPTPPHPDANSKKAKRRFPTLELDRGAALRWDSYVNLRHVYKIDWSFLRQYANPDAQDTVEYKMERESMIRLLAKSKFLTGYQTGPQLMRPMSPHIHEHQLQPSALDNGGATIESPISDVASVMSDQSDLSPLLEYRFLGGLPLEDGSPPDRPPRAPPEVLGPNDGIEGSLHRLLRVLCWPWLLLRRLWVRLWARQVSR